MSSGLAARGQPVLDDLSALEVVWSKVVLSQTLLDAASRMRSGRVAVSFHPQPTWLRVLPNGGTDAKVRRKSHALVRIW